MTAPRPLSLPPHSASRAVLLDALTTYARAFAHAQRCLHAAPPGARRRALREYCNTLSDALALLRERADTQRGYAAAAARAQWPGHRHQKSLAHQRQPAIRWTRPRPALYTSSEGHHVFRIDARTAAENANSRVWAAQRRDGTLVNAADLPRDPDLPHAHVVVGPHRFKSCREAKWYLELHDRPDPK